VPPARARVLETFGRSSRCLRGRAAPEGSRDPAHKVDRGPPSRYTLPLSRSLSLSIYLSLSLSLSLALSLALSRSLSLSPSPSPARVTLTLNPVLPNLLPFHLDSLSRAFLRLSYRKKDNVFMVRDRRRRVPRRRRPKQIEQSQRQIEQSQKDW